MRFETGARMELSLEKMLIEVWLQALMENVKPAEPGAMAFPVRPTPKGGLR